jgi:hypothetical protein
MMPPVEKVVKTFATEYHAVKKPYRQAAAAIWAGEGMYDKIQG